MGWWSWNEVGGGSDRLAASVRVDLRPAGELCQAAIQERLSRSAGRWNHFKCILLMFYCPRWPDRNLVRRAFPDRMKGIDAAMSNSDALQNRVRSLENAFFSEQDQKLLAGLKDKLDRDSAISKFREATGIQDLAVLEALFQLGMSPHGLAALRAFPLIAVAWADGSTTADEIATVRTIAYQHFKKDSAAGELVERWLASPPAPGMLEAWESCVAIMFRSMPAAESTALKTKLVHEINEVAAASGGLLGWGAVSQSEKQTMERIKAALA